MRTHYANDINYKKKEYSETHTNSQELFITNSPTRKRINRNNNQTKLKETIKEVTEKTNNKVIYDEVENICLQIKFREICGNCARERIIAVISLYVLRKYQPKLKEEEHKLWREYNLNWKLYSRIISNILRSLRKNSRI